MKVSTNVLRPTNVRVGPFNYRIEYPAEMPSVNADLEGLSDHRNHLILVHISQSEDKMREVLWHEIDHCIQYTYGMGGADMDGECQALVRGMGGLQVLRDNPGLVTWLVE